MSNEIKSILKVASIYITTIIGAGFASGQEIVQFFSTYYKGGFYGIVVAGILFALIGMIVLDRVYTGRIRNYDELIFPWAGYFFGWIMQIATALFMLSLFCIMLAGMGSIMNELFGIKFNHAVIIMVVICAAIILTDIKGIVALSTIISPVLITGIIVVALYILVFRDTSVFNAMHIIGNLTGNWFFSALLYVSYNTIMSTVVLCNLLPYLKTRRTGVAGGALGGLVLCFVAFILNLAIFIFYPHSISKDLPVLSIIEKQSIVMNGVYSLILWLAMFSSAITSGYCFIDRVRSKFNINTKLLAAILCAFAIPMAGFGFSELISGIYPVFGYIGLFLVFIILIQGFRASSFFKHRVTKSRRMSNF